MKIIDGAPQFEENDFDRANYMGRKGITLNQQLREWSESRRCVKCASFVSMIKRTDCVCFKTGIQFMIIHPAEFSCAEFEPKDKL